MKIQFERNNLKNFITHDKRSIQFGRHLSLIINNKYSIQIFKLKALECFICTFREWSSSLKTCKNHKNFDLPGGLQYRCSSMYWQGQEREWQWRPPLAGGLTRYPRTTSLPHLAIYRRYNNVALSCRQKLRLIGVFLQNFRC